MEREYPSESLAAWLLVLSVIGYAPVGLIGAFLDVGREFTAIPFRVLVLGISVLLILRRSREFPRWWGMRWLLLFWAVYSARLLWDWSQDMPGIEDALIFFTATTLAPGIALGLCYVSPNFTYLVLKRTLVLGGAFCALALTMHFFGIGRGLEEQEELTGGRLSFDTVNVIAIGHTAAVVVLALLVWTQFKLSTMQKFAALILLALSVGTMMMSGARAPIVALLACLVLYWLRGGTMRWILFILALSVPLALSQYSATVDRFTFVTESEVEEPSALSRLVIQAGAISQFQDNPILGDAYIERETLNYPHNIFIEAAMALGVIGLALLAKLLWVAYRSYRQMLTDGYLLIPMLLLHFFVAVQFSGSFWGNQAFWALLAVTTGSAWRHSRDARST